jgi:ATP-dependent Lon protease
MEDRRTTLTDPPSSDEYDAPALLAENVVIFPHTEVTITSQDERNTAALLQAAKERQLVVIIPGHTPKDAADSIGTLALVRRTSVTKEGVNALVKGLWRVRVGAVFEERTQLRVRFTRAEEAADAAAGRPNSMKAVFNQLDEFVRLIPGIPPEIIETLRNADTPGKLADLCAYSPAFSSEERLDLLKTLGAEERLEKVSRHFDRQLNALRELAKVKGIPECETCMELADRVFESDPAQRGDIALEFLNHVVHKHTGEVLGLLAERYGPEFMRRRALK